MNKLWRIIPSNKQKEQEFTNKLAISPLLSKIMVHNQFSLEEAQSFFRPKTQHYYDALLFSDMSKAIERIKSALQNNEKILIFGDYDVDGVTSTAILYLTLQELGGEVEFFIPDREKDGYGMSINALKRCLNSHRLLITVDCGITSISEVDYANQRGLDVIITDHHLPQENLPSALAILNPKLKNCSYPNKNLAGVGVAFKLAQALWQAINGNLRWKYLDIAAIGTIADMVPLRGENRALVKEGLANIENLGLKEMLRHCKIEPKNITSEDVAFIIGPRINAAGRLKHAELALELFLAPTSPKAQEIATMLDANNKERQLLVESVLQEAIQFIEREKKEKNAVIVVWGQEWKAGIIGIIAARLLEKYSRPCIVISKETSTNDCKGSCRSIPALHILKALNHCQQYLEGYGGHAQTAGLSIKVENLLAFDKAINAYAEDKLSAQDFLPVLDITAVLNPSEVNVKLWEELALLQPYGASNPKPNFLLSGIRPYNVKKIGKTGKHLRFNFDDSGHTYTVLGWKKADEIQLKDTYYDLVFQPQLNIWNGNTSVQLIMLDIKSHYHPTYPTREELAHLYLALKKGLHSVKQLQQALSSEIDSEEKVIMGLSIFAELNILSYDSENKTVTNFSSPQAKLNLYDSHLYCQRYFTQ